MFSLSLKFIKEFFRRNFLEIYEGWGLFYFVFAVDFYLCKNFTLRT